jgi:hypothetical protein
MLAMLCVYRLPEERYHLVRKIYTKNISYEVCHGFINYIYITPDSKQYGFKKHTKLAYEVKIEDHSS